MPTASEHEVAADRQAAMKVQADRVLGHYQAGLVTLEELLGELTVVVRRTEPYPDPAGVDLDAYRRFCEERAVEPSDWAAAQFALYQHLRTAWWSLYQALAARAEQIGVTAAAADPLYTRIRKMWAETSVEMGGL